jgi:hypothetical protein
MSGRCCALADILIKNKRRKINADFLSITPHFIAGRIHRRDSEKREGAQRFNESPCYPLRSLCDFCASAMNEHYDTH